MAGRGSPANSAGSARPKFLFLYFRNLRVKLCGNPSVRGPGPQLDFGRPGRPTNLLLGIFPAVSGRSYRGCRPGRPHQPWPASIRPSPAAGRPRPAPSDTAGRGGWRWPVPAKAGRSWPAPARGGRGWPVIALGILLVYRAHRDCQTGNRLVWRGIESLFQNLMANRLVWQGIESSFQILTALTWLLRVGPITQVV